MLHDWMPILATVLGTNGAAWLLIRWRWERRKIGADTAKVFTDMAQEIATEAREAGREAAAQARAAAQREHDENEILRAEVRELRAEVRELRQYIARMQQDVSATRTAVEHRTAEEVWSLPETEEPNQREGRDRP